MVLNAQPDRKCPLPLHSPLGLGLVIIIIPTLTLTDNVLLCAYSVATQESQTATGEASKKKEEESGTKGGLKTAGRGVPYDFEVQVLIVGQHSCRSEGEHCIQTVAAPCYHSRHDLGQSQARRS